MTAIPVEVAGMIGGRMCLCHGHEKKKDTWTLKAAEGVKFDALGSVEKSLDLMSPSLRSTLFVFHTRILIF